MVLGELHFAAFLAASELPKSPEPRLYTALHTVKEKGGTDPLPKSCPRSCERILVPLVGLERVL